MSPVVLGGIATAVGGLVGAGIVAAKKGVLHPRVASYLARTEIRLAVTEQRVRRLERQPHVQQNDDRRCLGIFKVDWKRGCIAWCGTRTEHNA